ncbi:MAG: HAD-IB family hydrolase [Muribaculaceae bacterium]|nr:HAD-IB family hydrolase [Muribaculaceae bacterium]
MKKETLALFDFDGTLTKKDSFIEFARHTVGNRALTIGIVKNFFWLCLWKLKVCNGGTAKQHLFSSLYRGMHYDEFLKYCSTFSTRLVSIEREKLVLKLDWHVKSGHKVYIVSASAPEWIWPWAKSHGINHDNIIGTMIARNESDNLTGRFSTPNCNGEEKVRRIISNIPDIDKYVVYAYGNSSGDIPMLNLADFRTTV